MINLYKNLLSRPTPVDFTYDEVYTILTHNGYSEIEGSGSRVSFGPNGEGNMLDLHKPHGGGAKAGILKKYQIQKIIKFLKEDGKL